MHIDEHLARVRSLSDQELLAGLNGALGSCRKLTALLLAHLGEVDDRRLHLIIGHGSLFAYCTGPLGMSEDEACRRIDVARLARRHPPLFEALARGSISLSVAALLKHHLTDENHAVLLQAVSGKTVERAREVLAAWFPRPDVAATIRKLPERTPVTAAIVAPSTDGASPPFVSPDPVAGGSVAGGSVAGGSVAGGSVDAPSAGASPALALPGAAAAVPRIAAAETPAAFRSSPNIAPLSPGRFKVTFTADAELKRKIELARDLLRHALPDGDLPNLIGRALDLLIDKTERRRFGKASTPGPKATSARAANESRDHVIAAPSSVAPVSANTETEQPDPVSTKPPKNPPLAPSEPPLSTSPSSRHLPANVRRAVLERDGQRCTWVGPDGTRCDSRAWLEHDHIIPRGQGGSGDPANIRHYCRAHNRLAAEQTYGRTTITRIIAKRRAGRASPSAAAP